MCTAPQSFVITSCAVMTVLPFPFVEFDFDFTTTLHFSILNWSHSFKRMLVLALLLTEKVLKSAFCSVGSMGGFPWS